jgi:hypothetical protein
MESRDLVLGDREDGGVDGIVVFDGKHGREKVRATGEND